MDFRMKKTFIRKMMISGQEINPFDTKRPFKILGYKILEQK